MANPQQSVKCEIGFAATPASDITSVVWTNVTDSVRLGDGITLRRGRQDETSQIGAGTASFSLDNRDGRFTPENTAGAYYPNVQLRRPVRFSLASDAAAQLLDDAVFWIDAQYATGSQTVPNLGTGGSALNAQLGSTSGVDSNDPLYLDYSGTPYVYLPGVASNYLSVPDAAALDIVGDIDVRARIALDDWTPASAAAIVTKQNGQTNNRSFLLQVNTDGTIGFNTSLDGINTVVATSTVATGFTDGTAHWIRVTLDVDNGASGATYTFYTSSDGVAWAALGTPYVYGHVISIFNSDQPIRIGAYINGAGAELGLFAGKVYRVDVLNGIDGTTVLDVDTSVIGSGAATTFTATTGQTVTVNRSTAGRKTACVVAPCWLFGTDDYMEVPDNALLDFGASDSFTVVAVVRQWAAPTANTPIVVKYDSVALNGWGLLQSDIWQGNALANNAGYNALAASPASTAGVLSSYSAIFDQVTDAKRASLNGVAGSDVSISTVTSLANAATVRIGTNAANYPFADMEFVAAAVFRRALSATEIAAISTYYSTRTFDADRTAFAPIWTGYIDSWGEGWNSGVQPVARVQASDLVARLQKSSLKSLITEEITSDVPCLYFPLNDSVNTVAPGNQAATSYADLVQNQAGSGGTIVFGQSNTFGADTTDTVPVFTYVDGNNGKFFSQSWNPIPEMTATSALTLEAYAYLPVAVPGTMTVVSLYQSSGAFLNKMALTLTANVPRASATINGTTVALTTGTRAINDGAWHHLALTYDGATLALYVDGVAFDSGAAVLGAATFNTLIVGASEVGLTLFNGWLAHVAVDNSVLSGTRLLAHGVARNGASGETSLARFNRVARIALGSWAVSASAATPSATMSGQPFKDVSAATVMQGISDAEVSPVYVSAAGVPVWKSRSERSTPPTAVSVPVTVVASDTGFTTSDQLVVNDVTYSRPGGATYNEIDTASVTAIGRLKESKSIYYDTDAQTSGAAAYAVNSRKDPLPRAGALTFDLTTIDAVVPIATTAALDIGSVIQVTGVPRGSSTTLTVFVEGVNDSITKDSWRRTVNTSPLRTGGATWVLQDATYGLLGLTTVLGI